MNEFTFRSGMGLMQKLFGHKLDSEIYVFYWDTFKKASDEEWKSMMEGVIANFCPSSQVPFPPIAIFQKHRPIALIDTAPRYGIEYKRPDPNEEIADAEFVENFIDSLPPIFRKHTSKRGGNIEKLGDILG